MLDKVTKNNFESPTQQLDLFPEENKSIESFSVSERKNITTDKISTLLNDNGEFFRTQKIHFSELNISQNNTHLYIKFTIRTNSDTNMEKDDLFIDIDINKTLKYNNISIKHSDIKTMGMRLEVLKYFVTTEGFHKLMTEIFSLNTLSDEIKNIEYHHKKHGSLNDYKEKEKIKYRGEKGILGKIGLSSNHFPELFLLKDDCIVEFSKNNFNFTVNIEIHNKIYTIKGGGIRTIDNAGNHQETISNVLFNNFNIVTENDFSNETIKQIERYINYYICEL